MVFETNYSQVHFRVDLEDSAIANYKKAVRDHLKYHTPSLDRDRRQAHNALAKPLAFQMVSQLGLDEPVAFLAARKLVADFFDSTLLFSGNSRVSSIMAQSSGLFI